MTKIDIISGFLGAGKTMFIKRLLEEAISGEQAVLTENEFDEVRADDGFLKGSGIKIREMNSGCICYSLVGDFGTSLAEVLMQYGPECIIIEPSGVGKLSGMMKVVIDVSADMDAELNSVMTIMDTAECKAYMENFGEFPNDRIENVGIIVLSRTGTTDASKIQKDVEMIREGNADVVIITTLLNQLDGSQFLEIIERRDTMLDDLLTEVRENRHVYDHSEENSDHRHHDHNGECHGHHDHGEECHGHHHGEKYHDHHYDEECHDYHHDGCGRGHDHHHHHTDEVFTSWGMETIVPMTYEQLEDILKCLFSTRELGDMLRAKGTLPTENPGE